MKKERQLELRTQDGDLYLATQHSKDEPWHIMYPEGDALFHGTVTEVKKHIRELMQALGKEPA